MRPKAEARQLHGACGVSLCSAADQPSCLRCSSDCSAHSTLAGVLCGCMHGVSSSWWSASAYQACTWSTCTLFFMCACVSFFSLARLWQQRGWLRFRLGSCQARRTVGRHPVCFWAEWLCCNKIKDREVEGHCVACSEADAISSSSSAAHTGSSHLLPNSNKSQPRACSDAKYIASIHL